MKKNYLSNKSVHFFVVSGFLLVSVFSITRVKASIFGGILSLFSKEEKQQLDDNSGGTYLLRPSISINDSNKEEDDSFEESLDIQEDGTLSVKTGTMRLSTEKEKVVNDTITLYEIKKGDTLDSVAKLFGVTKNTILWANNNIKNNKLVPGESILIFPISGIQYTAKKDIALSELAKNYKVDLDEIAEYNGVLKTAKLSKGESVFIPDAELEIASEIKVNKSKKKDSVKVVKSTTKIYKNNPTNGYFMRPISGCIKTQGLHGSAMTSVDFGCPVGTPTVAAASGIVIRSVASGYNGGYGGMVIISHGNGSQTIYAHLSSVNVSAGQTVSQGQVIGATGNTGRSTGPHLHFETRGIANPF